ncbi:hypothetical protein GGTG_09214 [Gaeumannomyces tritici R3-111a-1]|uniref:Uncharacterized protein n=1 Tax=Gaeumannomyces tritici (strain R3-111a-1) TaxID=644352 RepID=J3P6S2_GAET3|nr:hypothetical protein GGTG_09214 [Gaeumannomyces tritici R3-111a-1]EJT72348.1 hypothetical protein GGTG_09214 [Gaeumannomyces tritici R3-111a-1]
MNLRPRAQIGHVLPHGDAQMPPRLISRDATMPPGWRLRRGRCKVPATSICRREACGCDPAPRDGSHGVEGDGCINDLNASDSE